MEGFSDYLFEVQIGLHVFNWQVDGIAVHADCGVANCMNTMLDVTSVVELHKDFEIFCLLVRLECGLVLSATGEMYWGTDDLDSFPPLDVHLFRDR